MEVYISELIGKTVTSIIRDDGDEYLLFKCSDGSEYKMFHNQDCSECVNIEDITGDLDDLVDSPIIRVEESTNSPKDTDGGDSGTWTFYKLATNQGWVDIRWYGSSNGYYSESVSFEQIK